MPEWCVSESPYVSSACRQSPAQASTRQATVDHLPAGRGYDSSLHYFHHANDYFTEKTHNVSDTCPHDVYPYAGGGCFTDMWDTAGPATGQNGTAPVGGAVSHKTSGGLGYPIDGREEDYEEFKFKYRAMNIIAAHDNAGETTLVINFHCLSL